MRKGQIDLSDAMLARRIAGTLIPLFPAVALAGDAARGERAFQRFLPLRRSQWGSEAASSEPVPDHGRAGRGPRWLSLFRRHEGKGCSRARRPSPAAGYDHPKLKATTIALAKKYRPQYLLIEDASTGTALAQELRSVYFDGAVQLVPIGRDKICRLYVNEAKFEAGLVLFPKKAPFLPALEAELLTFPQGKTDDQVDSITQALSHELESISKLSTAVDPI
jgi:predicted phage terminase large subunit-like protein